MNRSRCYVTAITSYGNALPPIDAGGDYIVTSSAEVGILQTPRAQEVIRACMPKGASGHFPLVSCGCAGLFAAVLRFMNGPARTARILALETPSDYVQHTLDLVQLGVGGDGFIAQDVAYILDLQKSPVGAIARVEHCEIMSRPSCFAGTTKLARNFVARLDMLEATCRNARIITFENISGYAERLMQAVRAEIGPLARHQFLQTIEQDERHFMTVRPLLDLEHHLQQDDPRPVIVTSLGAGGRIGVFALVPNLAKPGQAPRYPATGRQKARARPEACLVRAPSPSETGLPAELLYMNRSFFGRANFYFEWNINGDNFQCTN